MTVVERKPPSRVDWKHFAEVSRQAETPYYLRGDECSLFMHAGTHGCERGSIVPFLKFILDYQHRLKGFCLIPDVSLTASAIGTRENAWHHNVNRVCWQYSPDPEAVLLQNIALNHGPFEVMVLVHEDTLPFYFYHQGKPNQFLDLEALRHAISSICDIGNPCLHTGYDDKEDPLLGVWFDQGYAHLPYLPQDGTFESWALNFGLAQTIYTIEIPVYLPKIVKYRLCKSFFDHAIFTNPALCK